MAKIKILELFSGVGTFTMALRDLGIPYELADSVEIDPYAVKAFNAIHGTTFEPQDILKWDKSLHADIVTGGFPCQDISLAGKQAGIVKGKTRSGLMYEMLRVVERVRPTWVIAENVKNLLSERHSKQLGEYIQTMFSLGYSTAWKVLDAQNFGVPQHRERVFIVSKKTSVVPLNFEFPNPIPLKKKLGDVLEKKVDEKYYLPEEKVKGIKLRNNGNVAGLLNIKGRESLRRVYKKSGVSPTLSTMQGGQRQPKIIDPQGRKNKINIPREFAPTLRAQAHGNAPVVIGDDIRVRRLTPRECWRLMGYSDVDFDKARKAGLSDTRLYKLAGNGIVLDVAKALLGEIYGEAS